MAADGRTGRTIMSDAYDLHPNDAPDSKFGSNGNYIFTVPGRPNMGVATLAARM